LHDNLDIQWSGYNDTLPLFVEETLKKIKDLNLADQKEFFDQCKEKKIMDFKNFMFE